MTEYDKHAFGKNLPEPSAKRGSALKLGIITALVVAITGAGLYWLSRDEEGKEEIKTAIKENVDTVIKDTPLEGVSEYISPPPPPPPSGTPPVTAPGTVAGQTIQGNLTSPETSLEAQTATDDSAITEAIGASDTLGATDSTNTHEQTQDTDIAAEAKQATERAPATPILPKVQEDAKVPAPFVDDMAQFFVRQYKPGKGTSLSLASLNMRYGEKMHMLMPEGSQDVFSARAALLRYAFNPPMLNALYGLYANRFLDAMELAASQPEKGKPLNPLELSNMFKAYASECRTASGIFEGISKMPDFTTRMENIASLTQSSLDIHASMTSAVFDLDTAREEKNTAAADAAQARIDDLNAQYQQALFERQGARDAFVRLVRRNGLAANKADADDILFVAAWLERRKSKSDDILESAAAVAQILDSMSMEMFKASKLQ